MESSGRSQLERGSEIGGYRIDALVSRGGMGVVYRATHLALSRIYALKVLAPELSHDDKFRQRFKREMRIAASLNHPNIVAIHYAGEDNGQLFFVMDFIQGSDLRDVLEKTGAIEPERAVALLMQLASALDSAHSRGLVHRDVKPANVLISIRDGEERVYLTDFGIARRSDTVAGLTAQGALVGTVDYMAPEQINGVRTDARTDIYALGCVFFQMLTGKVPYERDNSIAKLFAHVHDPPPSIEGELAELYPTFGSVIEKAMAKEPADRYLSAGDFARDAEAALSGLRYTGQPTQVATGEASPADPRSPPVETTPSMPTVPEPPPQPELPPMQPEPPPLQPEPLAPQPEPEAPQPEPAFETYAPGMPSVQHPASVASEPPPAAAQPVADAAAEQPGPAVMQPPPAQTEPAPPESEPAPPEPEPAPPEPEQPPPEPEPVISAPATPEPAVAAAAAAPAVAAADTAPPVPRGRSASRYRWPAVGLVALLAAAAVAVIVITSGGSNNNNSGTNSPAPQFRADAAPVPTNHVGGATGSAAASLKGNVLTVSIDTNGLLPNNAPHLIHIHAGGKGLCPPASAASLHHGHLSISTGDGIKFYGPPEVSLTTTGDTSAASNVAFARYPATGEIRYKRTLTLTGGVPAAIRAGNAVVVIHGVDYNHNGVYDNVLDRSDLDPRFTGESTAPALCGPLRPVGGAQASTGSTTFVASLVLTRVPLPVPGHITPAGRFWLLCHLENNATPATTWRIAGKPFSTAT